jgi:hypothetical protein
MTIDTVRGQFLSFDRISQALLSNFRLQQRSYIFPREKE